MAGRVFDLTELGPGELQRDLAAEFSRPAIARDRLSFLDEFIPLITSGKKTTTIRFRRHAIDFPEHNVLPIYATSNQSDVLGRVRIRAVRIVAFASLSEQDALNDGFSSLAELQSALHRIYGGIADEEVVSVYEFEILARIAA